MVQTVVAEQSHEQVPALATGGGTLQAVRYLAEM